MKDRVESARNLDLSRRGFLTKFALASLLLPRGLSWAADNISAAPRPDPTLKPAPNRPQRYRLAASDLMMLKRQKLGALSLARELGLDGVEVDMGGLGDRPTFDSKFIDATVRKEYLDQVKALGIEISSLAMTGFFSQSFSEREGVERTVRDCLDAMQLLNVKVAFLPLGIKGDLVKRPEQRPAVVKRLKAIAPHAEKADLVIGIETSLSADDEVKLLGEIGSPAIRSYFNFANPVKAGRDLCQELRILGRDRICQIHCTNEDGVWLQNDPKIDLKKIKKTLDELGWSGWLVIERSRDANDPKNVKKNFGANATYLKSIFQPA